MSHTIAIGQSVAWKWGNGVAVGTVENVSTERIEIETKGKVIVRNGTQDNPAIIIRQANGTQVLKLTSEVQET